MSSEKADDIMLTGGGKKNVKVKPTEPKLVYLTSSWLTKNTIERELLQKNEGLTLKNTVFVFPGNPSHNQDDTTLYSKKSGLGLAEPAGELGDANYPVLSLPTTDMDKLSAEECEKVKKAAVADLWKAQGAGYNLALPVRQKRSVDKNKKDKSQGKYDADYFFDGKLKDAKGNDTALEPSFWGGVEGANTNKPLANYYMQELNTLKFFMSLSPTDQRRKDLLEGKAVDGYQLAQENIDAYNRGIDFKNGHPTAEDAAWFDKSGSPAKKAKNDNSINTSSETARTILNQEMGYVKAQDKVNGFDVYKSQKGEGTIFTKPSGKIGPDGKSLTDYNFKDVSQEDYEKFFSKVLEKDPRAQITINKADDEKLEKALIALKTKYETGENKALVAKVDNLLTQINALKKEAPEEQQEKSLDDKSKAAEKAIEKMKGPGKDVEKNKEVEKNAEKTENSSPRKGMSH